MQRLLASSSRVLTIAHDLQKSRARFHQIQFDYTLDCVHIRFRFLKGFSAFATKSCCIYRKHPKAIIGDMENGQKNIVIGDESALFAFLHSDWGARVERQATVSNPLSSSAETVGELGAFNTEHPLYGRKPVSLLVPEDARRRFTDDILCRFAPSSLPERSFFQLREGLYMATPELVFLRMSRFKSEMQLAQIAMNLCARYFIDVKTDKICDRSQFLTTPEKLHSFCLTLADVRGARKALDALRWVYPNSGSPVETRLQLLMSLPLARGGFALPLTHMNYDVKAGRLVRIAEQNSYSIDCANPVLKTGVEFDGQDSHLDSSEDKRRRNELKALGWDIFPLEKDVFNSPDRMIRFAGTVAVCMGIRRRHSRAWPEKYLRLRKELGMLE